MGWRSEGSCCLSLVLTTSSPSTALHNPHSGHFINTLSKHFRQTQNHSPWALSGVFGFSIFECKGYFGWALACLWAEVPPYRLVFLVPPSHIQLLSCHIFNKSLEKCRNPIKTAALSLLGNSLTCRSAEGMTYIENKIRHFLCLTANCA